MGKVTVTIEGAQGAGKTRVADILRDALLDRDAAVIAEIGKIPVESRWLFRGIIIEIIEKQV